MPPPKLFINVDASTASLRPGALLGGGGAAAGDGGGSGGAAAALHAPSIEIGPSGTLKLFKSLQAFEFNPLGMTRRDEVGAPLARGAAAMQTSYKVWACGRAGRRALPGLRVEMPRGVPTTPLPPDAFLNSVQKMKELTLLPALTWSDTMPLLHLTTQPPQPDLGARRAHRAHAGIGGQRRGAEGLSAARVALCGHQEDLGAGARQAAPGGCWAGRRRHARASGTRRAPTAAPSPPAARASHLSSSPARSPPSRPAPSPPAHAPRQPTLTTASS